MICANCEEPLKLVSVRPDVWFHADSLHAWCGFHYDGRPMDEMPYPIPADQRATPTPKES